MFVVQGGYNMAHFAELNGSNVVQRVLVFSNVEIVRNGGDWSSEVILTSIVKWVEHGNNVLIILLKEVDSSLVHGLGILV